MDQIVRWGPKGGRVRHDTVVRRNEGEDSDNLIVDNIQTPLLVALVIKNQTQVNPM